MANCTIELSKADMKMLLKYVYCGHWLLTATKPDPDGEVHRRDRQEWTQEYRDSQMTLPMCIL